MNKLFEEFFDDIEQDELIDSDSSEDVFDDKSQKKNWEKFIYIESKSENELNHIKSFLDNCAYITDYNIEIHKDNELSFDLTFNIFYDGYMTIKEATKFCKKYNSRDFLYLITPLQIDKKLIQSRYSNGVLDLSGVKFEESVFIVKDYIDDYDNIKYIVLTGADTSNLKYLSFDSMYRLIKIYGIEDIDTSNLKSTRDMFRNCERLEELNIDEWDLSNVRDMSGMFYECKSLKTLNINSWNVSDWNVSNVRDMSKMFYFCESLIELNISDWNVSNVRDMSEMFVACRSLIKMNISNWDVSNVRDMSEMFETCRSLIKMNISDWNVSNVKNMESLFCDCKLLEELNISNWDVSKVEKINDMFYDCYSLKKLYLNKSFKKHRKQIDINNNTKVIYK